MSDQPQPFDLIGASVLAGRATPMPAPADLEPRTPLEQALARLWQAVLKVPSFSRLDNFFALGGDSLLATQVVARVRDELGLEVPLRQLFETPTLAGMADKLEAVQRQALGLETPPLRPMPRHGPIPLSLSQERMWFIQQLDPTSAAYNVPGAMRLTGDLDVGALRGALAAIVRRHESLRTAFTVVDGQPAQVIRPAADVEIAEIDLRGEPEAEREARARALAEAEASRPFDLSRAPLARLAVLRLAAADWIVVFNVHHTVSDAWSMGVFMREMTTLYAAQHAGRPAELPPLAVQYADFAIWQRGWLQGELLERQIAYWRKQLAGCPPLRLAADHPRPAVQTYRGAQHWVDLPPGLLGDLRRLCQAGDATVFMGLLAAFQILLGRYSGQADFAVGVPIANRRWQAAEEIIGSLVNTLVLRADLAGDPEFTTLLARVRETALGAFAHQDMPFAKLVAELQPERDLSRSPLIQVMFNVINVPMPELTFPGMELKVFELERYAAQFDLTLTVIDLEWMQRVSLEYNTDLFDAPTIEWMLDHYVALLLGLVQDPGRRLSELALLTPAERELLLHTWNATAAAAPAEPSLAQAFAAQAARTPRAVAVWDEHRRLTYAELDQRANQLARYLRAHGVGAESRVAVCLERSAETVAALLGVLKAGGAFVPLDPAYPRDRLAFMLQDSAAAVLLTQSHLAAQLPAPEGRLICLDTVAEAVARESAAELEPAALTPESAAYVIYTSGSTGQPKGVVGPHRAALNRFAWMWERYPFSPLDVACQKTALSFVDSIWELFGPLLRGVPTVVIPEAVVKDPARLVAALAAERVTRLVLVPSLLQTLLETVPDLAERLPDLQLWVSSGEALSLELAQRFHARLPGRRLLNLYGSSEVAADSLYYDVPPDEPGLSIPIGRPIANTQVYLLDEQRQLVPLGVAGEIYLGGAGLARGYLNRPELTAERFVPHPFAAEPGARLYRTGDLGRWRSDGVVEYLGRRDQQVKVRGMRVELGEIEAHLRRHPQVEDAVAVPHTDSAGLTQLAAYITVRGETAPAAADLRAFLAKQLPAHMLPAPLLVLPALPRTANGKVDRQALPAPTFERGPAAASAPPQDELELRLARLWEAVLGVPAVGRHDNFFDLGGHSLLVVRLFAALERQFGRTLPLTTLFQAPTVAELAELLRQQGWSPSWRSLVPLQPHGRRQPFFCVHEFDGNAFYYNDLARALGSDQPFFGLQAQGLDGRHPVHTSVEAMAAHYVAEVRSLQPEGPYYLGGSSLGGLVAYEMAQQLQAQGQPVALLALFDTYSPAYWRLVALPWRYRLSRHLSSLRALPPGAALRYVWSRARAWLDVGRWSAARRAQAETTRQAEALAAAQRAGQPLEPGLRDFHLRQVMLAAQAAYVPKPYPGRVVFFHASDRPAQYYHDPYLDRDAIVAAGFVGASQHADPLLQEIEGLGWGQLAQGGLEVHEVPGPHGFLVRPPHAQALGVKLRASLDAAQG